MPDLTRREVIAAAAGVAAAAVATPRAFAQEQRGAVSPFSTATQMLEALRAKRISAVELYDLHAARIQRFNGALNAIVIEGRAMPYSNLAFYPHVAIFCGLPATVFPAGFDDENLPIGLQAVGPYLEDRTPLRFAQLLEREWHAFTPPPDYA